MAAESNFSASLGLLSGQNEVLSSAPGPVIGSLDPLKHQFSDQKAISIRLQKLAAMARSKIEETEAKFHLARKQYHIIDDQRQELQRIHRDVKTNDHEMFLWNVENHYPLKHKQLGDARIEEEKAYWTTLLEHSKDIVSSQTHQEASAPVGDLSRTFRKRRSEAFFLREFSSFYDGDKQVWEWESGLRWDDRKRDDFIFADLKEMEDRVYPKNVQEDCALLCGQLLNCLATVVTKMEEWSADTKAKMESMKAELSILQKEELRCIAAVGFAELLSILNGPFY